MKMTQIRKNKFMIVFLNLKLIIIYTQNEANLLGFISGLADFD